MQCCYLIANDLPFLEMPTTKGPAVYVNFELLEGDCRQRFYKIRDALGVGDVDNLEVIHLRGKGRLMSNDRLAQLERIISERGFVVCALDPIYKLMDGKDERLGVDVAPVLGCLETIGKRPGQGSNARRTACRKLRGWPRL